MTWIRDPINIVQQNNDVHSLLCVVEINKNENFRLTQVLRSLD
jgi:hypothetical protein